MARTNTSSAYDAAAIVGVTVWGEAEGGLVINGEFSRFRLRGQNGELSLFSSRFFFKREVCSLFSVTTRSAEVFCFVSPI